MRDIVERLRSHAPTQWHWANLAADEVERLRSELDQARGMVEVARNGFLAIQKATIDGRVCDDVAWFSDIETLHDFCADVAEKLALLSTERADG